MTKGVAIILMVLVHARFSHYGDVFISMFHMPLFFFMSGYCFKEAYLDSFSGFFKSRVKGAYWPYVKWGLFFLLLHNIFFALNIYNGEYGFRGVVSEIYTTKDFLKHGLLIIGSMSGAEQLLGGYWFLHSYFFGAFITFCTIWLFRRRLNLVAIGLGVLLAVSVVMAKFSLAIPYYVSSREFLASAFMVSGFIYKRQGWALERYAWFVIPLGVGAVVLGAAFWPANMITVSWKQIVPYTISAFLGTLMVFSLCTWLCKYVLATKILSHIGDRTLVILTWHFLSFKIVSLIIIAISGLSIARLAEFPVIEEYAGKGWWMAYLAIGIVVPLLLAYLRDLVYVRCCHSKLSVR